MGLIPTKAIGDVKKSIQSY